MSGWSFVKEKCSDKYNCTHKHKYWFVASLAWLKHLEHLIWAGAINSLSALSFVTNKGPTITQVVYFIWRSQSSIFVGPFSMGKNMTSCSILKQHAHVHDFLKERKIAFVHKTWNGCDVFEKPLPSK